LSGLRLGLLQQGVTRLGGLDDYAEKLDRLTAEGAEHADLLVMPEYACMELAAAFTKVADPNAELEAVCDHAPWILDVMRRTAQRHCVWLLPGSMPWREGGAVRNRAPLIDPRGTVRFQDKSVMTRFETEAWKVAPGAPPAVFETDWGRIGVAICYDVEFPALVRAQASAGAWLILAPSCTDTQRGFNRVRLSARARALENQCFVAVAPTVGSAPWLATLDENRGSAGVYGPVDRGFPEDGVIVEGAPDEPGWVFATLDPAALDAVREDGAVRNFRDWPEPPGECPVQRYDWDGDS
jgi:predicted amidohydrolase